MSKLQEHFDKSTRGIIAQGGPATSETGGCFYRHIKGGKEFKCAIGQLIPQHILEAQDITSLTDALRTFLPGYGTDKRVTYEQLQQCHDNAAVDVDSKNNAKIRPINEFWVCFKAELHQFAMSHNLNEDVLKEIPIGQTA